MDVEEKRKFEIDRYIWLYEKRRERKPGRWVQYNQTEEWRRNLLEKFYFDVKDAGAKTVLDVGCGWGESVYVIGRRVGIDAFGVEVVPKLCDGQRITLIKGAHEIQVVDKAFDALSCVDVMEHIPEQDADLVLAELARVGKDCLIGISLRKDVWRKSKIGALHINIQTAKWWTKRLRAVFEKVGLYTYEGNPDPEEYLVVRCCQ